MPGLGLSQANAVIVGALRHGRALQCPPLTVAVLDPGGHLVALQREDGSGILRVEIAFGKAWGALGMGLPSRTLARRADGMPRFFDSLASVANGRMVPVPGGVLVRSADGEVIGAVGVSGDTSSDRDEECAVHGISQCGLIADIGTQPIE